MGKTSQMEKRLAGRVSLALAAGMFSVVPVAHGMPTGADVKAGGADVTKAVYTDTDGYNRKDITSDANKNVIHWKDFSIAEKEHVHFDAHDYMNVVTGQTTSAIDGKLSGGGDIYLINPNGVIFGSKAQVNVGNLYVSTRNDVEELESRFLAENSTGSTVLTSFGNPLTSEVVSLIDEKGYVAATKVVMEGRNIRFLNANALTTKNGDNAPTAGADGKFTNSIGNEHLAAGSVIFRANALGTTKNTDNYGDGYIHVGNGTSRYTAQYLNNHDATRSSEEDGVVNYSYLIRTVSDLQNINNDLLGNYMLTDDIDISTNPTAMGRSIGRANAKNSFDQPSGTAFHGHFDGMYYTIKNLNSANMKPSSTTTSTYGNDGTTYYMGLFAYTDGAKIENVGVVNATITTKYGGGVVGFANDTKLRNVWNAGGSNDNKYYIGHAYSQYVGGIVGYAKGDTQLTNVYNTGYVKGGGLVGALRGTSGIRNAYNIGKLAWDDNNTKRYNGIVVSSITGTTINNVYSASKYVGGSTGGIELIGTSIGNNTTTNAKVIVDTKVNADDITLSDWIANAKKTGNGTDAGNTTISSDGASAATWRIYEGYSLPLLNSFMKAKGTVSTEYTYGDTDVTSSNYNKDAVPNKVYDAKTVMGDTPVYSYLGANVTADTNLINVNNRKNVYTDNDGNAAKFALFSGGQQGYDLYGNNFKIEQRNISYNGSGTKNFSKEYDSTKDGTNVLKALFSASSTSSDQGFLDADAANVKFVLGSGVSATYNDEDVLEAYSFTISGTEAPGAIKLEAAQGAENPDAYKNYKVGTVTNLDGTYTNGPNATVQITPRSIKVSLKETDGITKTYDGTATVTDQNKGETDGFLPNENVVIESGRVLDRDNGVAVTCNANARYVDVGTNALTSAVNAGDHKVAYEGIALTGGDATKRANYKLVDSSNADLTAGYILADGTISKRKITANDLTSPTGGGPTKTYDGTSTGTASTTVGVDESMLVDKAGGTRTHDNTTTGLLYSDKDLVKLTTTGNVTFGYEDAQGFHASADATTSGYTTAANKAQYTVALDTENSDATAVANYEIDANTQVTGNGTINKRNISATLDVPDGGIVKTYDGTATVSNPQVKVLDQLADADAADSTRAKISITAVYKAGNGFGAKDVAYTDANSDTVTTKDIQYKLELSGSKAANYNLTAAAADADSDNNALTGTIANAGKINPAELGLTITSVSKRYDTTYDVNTTAAPNTVANAITATTQNSETFNEAAITGRYGVVNTNGTFTPDPNVAYNGENVAEKDVEYSGFHAALGDNYKNYTIQGKTWKTSNTAYGKGTIYKAKIGATELAQKTNIVNPQPTLTKTYDGSTNYDVSGLTASDFLTVNYAGMAIPDNSLNYTIAHAVYTGDGAKNVGTNKGMTMTFTFQTNGLGNFELTSNGTDTVSSLDVAKTGYKGNITAKDLTLTLNQDAVTKVYDGTDTLKASGTTIGDATIKGWFGNLATNTQIVSGDTVEIELYENDAHKKAYYDNKNASTSNKNIYISQVGLTGADAGNYRLKVVDVAGTKTAGDNGKINDIQGVGTISKRTITVANVGAVDRDYNGSALVTKTSGTNSAGAAYDDTIRITLNEATQEGKSDWDVLYGDGLLDGANRASTTGLIKNVGSITGTYQNSVDNEGAANVRRDSNDRDNILTKSVTYTGLLNALGGANGNYSIVDTATGQGTITPVKLKMDSTTVALPNVANSISRTYDATTAVSNPNTHLTIRNATIQEKYNSGVLLLDGASYNNKNVGENKTVTYKFKLNPEENINNYDLFGDYDTSTTTAQLSANVGKITPATIAATISANADTQKAVISRTYDGSTAVDADDALTAKTWLGLSGVFSGDTVSVDTSNVSLAYKNKNVASSGDADKVTYSDLALTGDDKDNYQLASATISGYGTINAREIAVQFSNDIDKLYDGTATVTNRSVAAEYDGATLVNPATNDTIVASWADSSVIVGGDNLSIGGTISGVYGTWDDVHNTFTSNADVVRANDSSAVAQDVLYKGFVLTGADAGNYTLTNGKNITLDGNGIGNTVYFQAYKSKGTIRPLAITMDKVKNEWGTFNKVYNGSSSVMGYLADGTATDSIKDRLTIYYDANANDHWDEGEAFIKYNVAAANYVDANGDADASAGTNKAVAYTGFTFNTQALSNNFDINANALEAKYADGEAATKTTGNIARRLLNVTPGTNNVKIYDGSEVLVEAGTAYTASMTDATNPNATGLVVGHDNVSVTYAANFDDKNASVDPDADASDAGWTAKNVTYIYTLADGGDSANYTLVSNPANDAAARTTTKNTTGGIKRREVYVDFSEDGQGHSYGEDLDKTYDGNSTPLLATGMSVNDILTLVADGNDTGIVAGEESDVYLKDGTVANYVDANGNVSADADAKLGITTTREVYFQNFALDGARANNYVVKVKNGANKKSVTDPTTTTNTLIGKGKINQRVVDIALKDDGSGTPITKVYNRSEKVEDYTDASDVGHKYASDNVKILPATGVNDGLVDGDNLGLIVDSAIYFDKTAAGSDTPSNPEIYATYNAGEGLGVSYKLKWDNQNYTLVKTRLYGVNGEIKQRTLVQQNSPAIVKTYDGTTALGDTSSITKELFGNDVLRGDEETLLTIDRSASQYARANVYAATDTAADIAAAGTYGTAQDVTVVYTLNDAGSGKNYQLAGTVERGDTYNGVGTGRINRAQVTMTPTEVSYYPSQLATATYTGQVAGFVNGDNRPTVTYGRDGNTSMLVGKYTLLGYVNGKRVPVNGETFADGFENYYFTTKKNSALTILAEPVKPVKPVKPDVPDIPTVLPDMGNKPVTKVVTESVISDTKFTPDEYSYNRMSKDPDTTHVNRVSSATLQYSEKGVNLDGDDTKSGLASLADIQGRGSVVNLNGALIQTSAPAERPEKVAETAALPISEMDTTEDATSLSLPEKEENDDSSIGLEYADNTGGSQSVLEILTNASSKAENKGTSIVIDTQDEDEEDAEVEKTRRAIFADRSNIGIETLGNAVNLNQMIG